MRGLTDPELGGHGAPWEQLLASSPHATPSSEPQPEETAQEAAEVIEDMENGVPKLQNPATKPPPLRRRHTFADSLSYTLQPLLPRSLLMPHQAKPASESPPTAFRYRRQSRFSSRRVRRRVVFKHGECNVVQTNVAKRHRRYLQDIFTTLVDAQWRWTLLVFALNFVLSWLAFALVWFAIAAAHGDLKPEGERPEIACVTDLYSFSACFLFSVETQHTIGYGSRATTEECPEAIIAMCIQCITGVMIQAFMVGIVFAKLSRPKKRTQTLLFSRNAVICQRDGHLCLMFRVGDMRRSHIVEAHVRAQLIKQRVSAEGEILPFYQHDLRVGGDGAEDDRIFFIWPTTIVHQIDETSPLYRLSASDMLRDRFEVVVILEGVVESTGMTTQARSSYLPSEVLWGHRFETLVTFKKERGEYEVDYSRFNNTFEVETPLCSAEALDQLRKCSVVALPQALDHLKKCSVVSSPPALEQLKKCSTAGQGMGQLRKCSFALGPPQEMEQLRKCSFAGPPQGLDQLRKCSIVAPPQGMEQVRKCGVVTPPQGLNQLRKCSIALPAGLASVDENSSGDQRMFPPPPSQPPSPDEELEEISTLDLPGPESRI